MVSALSPLRTASATLGLMMLGACTPAVAPGPPGLAAIDVWAESPTAVIRCAYCADPANCMAPATRVTLTSGVRTVLLVPHSLPPVACAVVSGSASFEGFRALTRDG